MPEVLFGKTNGALLSLLYAGDDEAFYLREIMKTLGLGSRSAQAGIKDLTKRGLISRSKRNGKYFYSANKDSAWFTEIRGLVARDSVVRAPAVLRAAIKPLKNVRLAFIFGSTAKNTSTPDSDIDVFLVGDGLTPMDMVSPITMAQHTLRREINPVIYTPTEFKAMLRTNHFVDAVSRDKKTFLVGDEDELERLRGETRT